MKSLARKILIIRRKAVGDLAVSMATARALKEAWPQSEITLLVDRGPHEIAIDSPYLKALLVYDRRAQSEGSALQKFSALRTWLTDLRSREFDVVLDLMGTPQTALWTASTRAPIRIGRKRRGRSWAYSHRLDSDVAGVFAGAVFLESLLPLGLSPPQWSPVPIPLSGVELDEGRRVVEALLPDTPRILLVPSATWPAKAWPLEHFASLASQLPGTVALAWGPGEESRRQAILNNAESSLVDMPPSRLRELTAQLAAFDLVIAGDCGPKHLAVAMGTPTLTLFGSTDPAGWQPPGTEHQALWHDVPCRPCNRIHCNVPGHPCLSELLPERVAAAARSMLGERNHV